MYHGWMIGKVVATGIGMAPTRENIYTKLGLTPDNATTEVGELVEVLGKVVGSVQALLDTHGADFPDKA